MTPLTADQIALQAHIEAANAKHAADCAARGVDVFCTTVSDPEHWALVDVFNIEQFERQSLISYISDAHKDAYGFRPRGNNYDEWSMEALEAEADRMSEAVTRAIEEDRVRENQAIAEFERSIENLISVGAGNRATAIRWICDSIDHGGDLGYVCYELGLPYTMESELQAAA